MYDDSGYATGAMTHTIGIVMNGVTGRMGLNRNLRRSIHRQQEVDGTLPRAGIDGPALPKGARPQCTTKAATGPAR